MTGCARRVVLTAVMAWTLLTAGDAFAEQGRRLLWQIGRPDNATAEFALAPGGFRQFQEDGFFVVGQSDAKRDWPYVHPGPADTWAGGAPHTFTILFGLKDAPRGVCRLIVDLADTHGIRPPKLGIAVNGGGVYEHQCPPGGTDASIGGDLSTAKEDRFAVDISASTLRRGLNRITITNLGLSWVLYDWVGFEGPPDSRGASTTGAFIERASVTPWLSKTRGRLTQQVDVDVVGLNAGSGLTVVAPGVAPESVALKRGKGTAILRLPPVKAPKTVTIELRRGGVTLDTRTVKQRPARERQPVDYVDCLLGTASSRWMLYPGPSLPFGMVKLSPDNQRQVWKAGHEYTLENIAGFSHIHSWTMGGLLTMPTVGALRTVPGPEKEPDKGYRSRFRHQTEVAVPGYYAVTLDDYGIRAELTCTTRAGFQRYTFPKANQARILFDLETPTEYGYDVLEARITKVSDTEIEGYSRQRGRGGARWNDYTVHFVARVNKPFTSLGGWVGKSVRRNVTEISGKGDVGCFLNFSTTAGEQILLQTGISLVSVQQARLNLDTEMREFGWDFDACRQAARKTWNDLLCALEVEGGTETDKVKFYTNMYRAYCARTIWSDVNGKYVDMYEQVRQLRHPDCPVYGCDAFWNTFWNLNQLWILVHPDMANKWVRSLLEINRVGGWLPKGPTGIEYSSIMVASHEIALIVAAFQAGIRDYNVQEAYRAVRHVQTTPGRPHPGGGYVGNRQLESYMKLGFVPVEKGPVSNTLEYAYDDWCAAQFARALGKTEDYHTFLKRSRNYRNVFDPVVGFVRQKHANGTWVSGFSPFAGQGFVEGTSWQYTWFVPHDVAGLIDLLGRDNFNRRLEAGLEASVASRFNGIVNHGNQPNMQSCWLFDYSGRPWLTQKWEREILDRYYGAGPLDGYPGDEDQGQMGAWFVMSAMGLFQMDGGCAVRPVYEIGSPLFDRIVVHLDPRYYPGRQFVIETRHNSKENRYVQSATLDGRPLHRPWLYQWELVDGGKLILDLGPKPNKRWGSGLHAAPPSLQP